MGWSNWSRDLSALLDEAVADFGCERRMLLGGPAYTVNGHAFAIVHAGRVAVRVAEDVAESACEETGGILFSEGCECMGTFVVLPPEIPADATRFGDLLHRSFDYTRSMPQHVAHR